MNRLSTYGSTLTTLLGQPDTPFTKRQLSRLLNNYLKATAAEIWEPTTHTRYLTVSEPIAQLTGLPIGSRYYFFEDGITVHPWWDFVTLVHRRWWQGWATPPTSK